MRSRNLLLEPSRNPDPRVRVVNGSSSARALLQRCEGPRGTGRLHSEMDTVEWTGLSDFLSVLLKSGNVAIVETW